MTIPTTWLECGSPNRRPVGMARREPDAPSRRRTTVRIVALALTLAALAACGGGDEVVSSDDPRPSPTSSSQSDVDPPPPSTAPETTVEAAPTDPATAELRYTATATVLESPDHGPQLCLGGVAESYPPQCGGPDVVGWSWDAVAGEDSANGTTWGHYTVVGTWDGERLTLTEPPSQPTPPDQPPDDDRFATPCPAPAGGWQVVDAETATDEAMQAAIQYANAQADVGGVWLDQSINPASRQQQPDEAAMNDPTRLVLNVTFTGGLRRHEEAIRQRWGGPLCVSEAAVSRQQLGSVRAEVEAQVGDRLLYSSVDEVRGQVEVAVVIDDGLQQRLDERYGQGVVEVQPALRPVDG